MSNPVLYGIANCDTVKKARKWLEQNNIEYVFHDFRKDGLAKKHLEYWFNAVDWTQLLNKRSTTWRALADGKKNNLTQESAGKLMLASPTLIKRPVLVSNKQVLIGFNPSEYKRHFG
jgi:arsenate reductase